MREEGGSLLPSRMQRGNSQKWERNKHIIFLGLNYVNETEFSRLNAGLWEGKSEYPYRHEANMFNRNTRAVSHEGKWVLTDGYFRL